MMEDVTRQVTLILIKSKYIFVQIEKWLDFLKMSDERELISLKCP